MHFHAEHSLFFDSRRPLGQVKLALSLTSLILVLNVFLNSVVFSICAFGLGLVALLIAYLRGHSRFEPLLACSIVLIACGILGGTALNLDTDVFLALSSRILCGVVWGLWLGTQVDWPSLRKILLVLRMPHSVVATLDHSLMHSLFTRSEWTRRRDTARLRQGTPKLSLRAWGKIIGEGALHSVFRLEVVEENALLRGSSAKPSDRVLSLRLEGVSLKRDGKPVLKSISFSVQPGEWVLVCGPSGAGKSSLLRLLAGLDAPTEGVMTRFGGSLDPSSSLKQRLDSRVAILGQNPEHHFIGSTVGEDIAWGLIQRGVRKDDAHECSLRMAQALKVDHLMERPCHALSFGEQRRVALAGLLVLEPLLLLLDEPTAGLDPVAAHDLRSLVEEVAIKSGAACIWATHDLATRPSMAERVLLIKDAELVFDGTTIEGLSAPRLMAAGLAVAERGS